MLRCKRRSDPASRSESDLIPGMLQVIQLYRHSSGRCLLYWVEVSTGQGSSWFHSSHMNIVSHVTMRMQVRPRTESEGKFRCNSQLNRSTWLFLRHSTYIQLLLLSKPKHVGLIMLVAKVVCDLLFVRCRSDRNTTVIVQRLLELDCVSFGRLRGLEGGRMKFAISHGAKRFEQYMSSQDTHERKRKSESTYSRAVQTAESLEIHIPKAISHIC